jgi:hypothetical protein
MVEVPDFLKPLEKVTRPFPREAVEAAIARREDSVPVLLEVLVWSAANAEDVPDDYLLHEFALRLLAQFRDVRAYEAAVRLARHSLADELLGDTLSADLGPILASVSGGDPRLIQELIEDGGADEFARWAGLRALGVLCREGLYSREALSAYLGELLNGKLAREGEFVWTGLVDLCAIFGLTEHLEAVRKAVEDGLVDDTVNDWPYLEKRLKSGKFLESEGRNYRLFDDAIASMENWHCFKPEAAFDDEREEDLEEEWEDEELPDDIPSWEERLETLAELPPPPQPVRVEAKPGRNDPCPCGSGKKYKKCCG